MPIKTVCVFGNERTKRVVDFGEEWFETEVIGEGYFTGERRIGEMVSFLSSS